MTGRELGNLVKQCAGEIRCSGLMGAEQALIISDLYHELKCPLLIIMSSDKDCERFKDELEFFFGRGILPVIHFPNYNLLPFRYVSYHNDIAARRISTLYRLLEYKEVPIVLVSVESMLSRLIPRQALNDFAELIQTGEDIASDQLIAKLISGGYSRTAIVEEPGDFGVRGGIIDIYSPQYEHPVRIELFGDQVESLRFFSAVDQRKLQEIDEVVILPSREAIINQENQEFLIANIRKCAAEQGIPLVKTREMIHRLTEQHELPGIDSYLALVYPQTDIMLDYLPMETVFVLVEPQSITEKSHEFRALVSSSCEEAAAAQRLCVDPAEFLVEWEQIFNAIQPRKFLSFSLMPMVKTGEKPGDVQSLPFKVQSNTELVSLIKENSAFDSPFEPLLNWITEQRSQGISVVFACGTKQRAERLRTLLTPYGLAPKHINSIAEIQPNKPAEYLMLGYLKAGFVWHERWLAVVTDTEIFGPKYRRRKQGERKKTVDPVFLGELKQGDLIVHNDHGIGRYQGLQKIRLEGETGDFLLIEYRGGDKLYLPVERMGVVQKYMGVEGVNPVVDKMGGKTWEKIKNKVKKSVELIAGDLLNLYAERKAKAGHAYQLDDRGLAAFEAGFVYDETTDQIEAIRDVLNDMTNPVPMDRLICGDVGYGKTEVALRASFLAVSEGRQTAVLVPTTVLAEQHFETFSLRYKSYPVNIACLSRFRSPKQQKEIIENLKHGKIDIVIGTHRLIQKDVEFKQLGLLILDEEQRFGVKHKERLKQLRSSVDVLALTATPIPRTLHLSLLGIRDISVISTPPEHRRSIVTYIAAYDNTIVSQAIRKELDRGGQIFFIHNNVKSIWHIAKNLAALVPEVRIGVAHGQMNEEELEYAMMQFVKREIDLLVCTTIIESGIDIPSANTILINRADRFGLAQIYQLRGRVGRSEEQAYAYLFVPTHGTLSKDAQKRLKVLMEHSDLGAGFQIAMSDLQLRGGGTILGASQSGHIAAVGYDMFLQLMENAMNELKGVTVTETLEPEIHFNEEAFIPETYITDIDHRLQVYRRLAKFNEIRELSDFKTELEDRFGSLPPPAANLLLKIMLKILAAKAGIKRLDFMNGQVQFIFSEQHLTSPASIQNLIRSLPEQLTVVSDYVLKAKLSGSSNIAQCKKILKDIVRCVNK